MVIQLITEKEFNQMAKDVDSMDPLFFLVLLFVFVAIVISFSNKPYKMIKITYRSSVKNVDDVGFGEEICRVDFTHGEENFTAVSVRRPNATVELQIHDLHDNIIHISGQPTRTNQGEQIYNNYIQYQKDHAKS